ncbi:MAG: alpha/beta fold hydrolase [Actinophytocola sp.]|nr:alpha/beta fold hydrolase [Actinophytocola sp.]
MAETQKLTFPGSQGELAGRIELPVETPRAWALFAHCFTCGADIVAATRISRALAEACVAVLRFDFTGLGHSHGEFANATFSSNIDDLVHAADHLREHYAAPTILIGHSLGGAAVLAAAERIPETKAVATVGAPADPAHVTKLFAEGKEHIEAEGEADVCLAGRSFRIKRQFLDDIAAQPQAERIANLRAALLVMHSPIDELVSVDNARQIFDAAKHPKSFVAIDGAKHLLPRPGDARFVASVLAAWAARYAFDPADPEAPADEGAVEVSESHVGSYGQRIKAGGHALTADEPEPLGANSGPSPYDLLLAALGACTSMTVRMYADRKQWPLDDVHVALRHAKIHAEDCAHCDTRTGMIDQIERRITLTGGLDDDQRAKLLEIADKCPVHRTLHAEVDVQTSEARG